MKIDCVKFWNVLTIRHAVKRSKRKTGIFFIFSAVFVNDLIHSIGFFCERDVIAMSTVSDIVCVNYRLFREIALSTAFRQYNLGIVGITSL